MSARRGITDAELPIALAQRRFDAHRDRFDGLGIAERFARIHEMNLWGADTSVSGLGSEMAATATIRKRLGDLLRQLGARSLRTRRAGTPAGSVASLSTASHMSGSISSPT